MSGFNGFGVFSFTYDWTDDKAAGVPITASRMDTQFADATSGFNNCLTRDGQGKPSANIDWNTKKITNAGNPTSGQDLATLKTVQRQLRRNFLVNGDFRIWQRVGYTGTLATVASTAAGQYTCDRWFTRRNAAGSIAYSIIQDNTLSSSTPCPNAIQIKRTAADANLEPITLCQAIDAKEVLDAQQYLLNDDSGNSGYLQFSTSLYIGANFSGANMKLELKYSNTANANALTGAGWTSLATTTILTADLGVAIYRRHVVNVAAVSVPSSALSLGVFIYYTPTGVAGADDSFHASGALLEVTETPWDGTAANNGCYQTYPIERFDDNVRRCERYYQKSFPIDTAPAEGVTATYFIAHSQAANAMTWGVPFRTRMRAAPTAFVFFRPGLTATASQPAYNAAGVWTAGSASASANVDETGFIWTFTSVSAAGQAYGVAGNWTASAEL